MKNFILTFGITLALFLGVSLIVYLWDTQQGPEIESVRITVDSGTVKENASGQEITTGEQLTVHANGKSELISLQTPVPTAVNIPVISQGTREVTITVVDDDGQTIPKAAVALASGSSLYCNDEGKAVISLPENIATSATIAADGFFMKSETPIGIDETEVTITLNRKMTIYGEVFDPDNAPNAEAHLTVKGSSAVLSATENQFAFYPLVAGEYILLATHPAYLGVSQTVQAGASVTIHLKNEGTAAITLKTSQNEIVANAQLAFQSHPDSSFIYLTRGTTDINGQAVFQQLKRGFYTVSINHAWYISNQPIVVEVDEADERIDLVIPDNQLDLSGTVYDAETNMPLANIPVVSVLDQGTAQHSTQASPLPATKTVMTDENGQYHFNDLISGRYTVYIDDVEGYISGDQRDLDFYSEDMLKKVALSNINAENVDFKLERAWSVSGTVYDPNEKPMPEQTITARNLSNYNLSLERLAHFGGVVKTDSEGKYEMVVRTSVPPGTEMTIRSEHKVYWKGSSDNFQIKPGEKKENVDLHFKGGAVIQGYVRNELGESIENAFVYFINDWGRTSDEIEIYQKSGKSSVTDQNGFYECVFSNRNSYGMYTGVADAKGYRSSADGQSPKKIEINISDEPIKINFTLQKGDDKTIEGVVVNENGEAVSGVTVRLSLDAYANYGKSYLQMNPGIHTRTITDAMGIFKFDIDFFIAELFAQSPELIEKINTGQLNVFGLFTDEHEEYEARQYAHYVGYPGEKNVRIVVKRKEEKQEPEKTGVSGLVVTSDGKPLKTYELLVVPSVEVRTVYSRPSDIDNERSPYYQWTPVFSAEGRFQIDNLLVAHGPFYIGVRSEEYGIASSERLFPKPDEIISGVKIVLGKGATIYGTVVDAQTGEPIPGLNIVTMLPPSPARQHDTGFLITKGSNGVSMEDQMQSLLNGNLPTAVTNEKGQFTLKGAPVPSTFLHILPSNGYDQYTLPIRPLSDGQTRKIDPIRLKPLNPVPVSQNE